VTGRRIGFFLLTDMVNGSRQTLKHKFQRPYIIPPVLAGNFFDGLFHGSLPTIRI
jgi:hypothetical protein